jgi:hypothetical protein
MSNDQFATSRNPVGDNGAVALGGVGFVTQERSALTDCKFGQSCETADGFRSGQVGRKYRPEFRPPTGACSVASGLRVPKFPQVEVTDAGTGQTVGQRGLSETSAPGGRHGAHVYDKLHAGCSQCGIKCLGRASFVPDGE